MSNPNAFSVHVGSFVLDTSRGVGGFAVDSDHPGCPASTLGFTAQTNGGVGWTVPAKVAAGSGTLSATLPSALSMSMGAANSCQGVVVTIYLMVGP